LALKHRRTGRAFVPDACGERRTGSVPVKTAEFLASDRPHIGKAGGGGSVPDAPPAALGCRIFETVARLRGTEGGYNGNDEWLILRLVRASLVACESAVT
jgi:hypothetical protein